MIHEQPHPQAGQTVTIDLKHIHPQLGDMMIHEVQLYDWWDRVGEGSWINEQDKPICRVYGVRNSFGLGLPVDDEVIIVGLGDKLLLIHETEIME